MLLIKAATIKMLKEIFETTNAVMIPARESNMPRFFRTIFNGIINAEIGTIIPNEKYANSHLLLVTLEMTYDTMDDKRRIMKIEAKLYIKLLKKAIGALVKVHADE